MNIKQAREAGIFKKKIYLGEKLGLDNNEDQWIVLREMTGLENSEMAKEGEKSAIETFIKVFPNLLIDHNFVKEDNSKEKHKDVVDFIMDSSSLLTFVTKEWLESLPLSKKKNLK